jgi:DNA primase
MTHGGPTVSFYSSVDAKEQVRQAIDIVDLVGRYVQLRRSGRNYVGLCPWHDDTRPSLQVNPERQSFKCWVCDIGGDIFSFAMKMEGVDFREALEMLADQSGIELQPYRSPRAGRLDDAAGAESTASGPEQTRGPGGKRRLYQAMAWAEEQYHDCLVNSAEGEPARKYLLDRGITEESIRKFHLGYSPNRWDWIADRARQAKANVEILETVGILARPPEGGNWYDRFRGRLLFSIRDPQDRPVGLGGRVLPETASTSPAKYVNSPETPLFSKSRLLYGLDIAREAMRKSRSALVMEGYTDCIVAHQFGFQDAVAVLGTSLGDQHIRTLKRFVDRIILVLDGDEAGQRRANEVLELFVAEKADLRIVTLPEGLDPADFLLEHGAEALGDLIAERAMDALEHAFQACTRGVNLADDVHHASAALERLVAIVAKAPRLRPDSTPEDRFREEKILQRLAARFRVPEQDVRQRLTELRRAARRRPAVSGVEARTGERIAETKPTGKVPPWQRELLEILIRHPDLLPKARAEIRSEQLADEPCRQIYEACCRLTDASNDPSFDRLMLEFDDPAIKSLLVELDEKGSAKGDYDPEALLEDVIRSYQQHEADRQRPHHAGALREGGMDETEELELLDRIVQEARNRHGISRPTEG